MKDLFKRLELIHSILFVAGLGLVLATLGYLLLAEYYF